MNVQPSEKLVSVIIPTFNHGLYIERAIQSIKNQTYSNWEVLIIDNYSTDSTGTILQNLEDQRIKVIKFNNEGVIGASRNIGLKKAKGDFIAFLDSDDWWRPTKLKLAITKLEQGYDVFYHEMKIAKHDDKLRYTKRVVGGWQVLPPVLTDLLIRGNALANSSVVTRRKMIEQVSLFSEDRDMVGCEDYNLWLKLSQITERFYFCPEPLGYYLVHGSNGSASDMSLPYLTSVKEFLKTLNKGQKMKVHGNIEFVKMKYLFKRAEYSSILRVPITVFMRTSVLVLIKALCIYLVAIFRKTNHR